ncbi:MAG TPA: NAD-dependent epimerase/dehydratase family protein [Myxococcales bacterium]|nr:NAD-dependent epimerase/dehydratase family protein [Myxococcales bacterium]
MRTFVTGGSGFLGRTLIRVLREKGHEVLALARSDAAAEAVRAAGAEPVRGDLDQTEAMRAGMSGCQWVFHSAALAKAWGKRADFVQANVRGTENVLEASLAAGVKRLVHVSTEAVLVGGGPILDADEARPLPRYPIGLYSLTKGWAEKQVLAASSPERETVVVRPRLIWGKDDTTVLAEVVKAVKDGRFLWISGGRYLTSTCHVRNVAEGMILAALRGKPKEVYFLTDGAPVEFRAFMTELLRTQGVTPPARSLPRPLVALVAVAGEALWSALRLRSHPPITRSELKLIGEAVTVNDRKAREELGYQPVITREEGLREMASASAV